MTGQNHSLYKMLHYLFPMDKKKNKGKYMRLCTNNTINKGFFKKLHFTSFFSFGMHN